MAMVGCLFAALVLASCGDDSGDVGGAQSVEGGPTATSTPASVAPTPVGPGPCDGTPDLRIIGEQTEQLRLDGATAGSLIDLKKASWIDVDDWPVDIRGGSGMCVEGGVVRGVYPDTTDWDLLHSTGAINLSGPGVTTEGVRVDNYGDGIRIRDDSDGFTVHSAHLTFIRDDCVENDRLYGGEVTDSLLDGCYVAFSARPKSSDETSEGSDRTFAIRDSLVRLQPMPTVYKGDAPGHGGFFKWDKDGRGPTLELHGNVFRVDQESNHTGLGVPPELGDCSDNVVVWLGDGAYPDPLPDCFTVTSDASVWDSAVEDWHARR